MYDLQCLLYNFKLALGFINLWRSSIYFLIKHIDKCIQHSCKCWQSIDKGSKSYSCASKNLNLIHHISFFAIEHWIWCLRNCPLVQNCGPFWLYSLYCNKHPTLNSCMWVHVSPKSHFASSRIFYGYRFIMPLKLSIFSLFKDNNITCKH